MSMGHNVTIPLWGPSSTPVGRFAVVLAVGPRLRGVPVFGVEQSVGAMQRLHGPRGHDLDHFARSKAATVGDVRATDAGDVPVRPRHAAAFEPPALRGHVTTSAISKRASRTSWPNALPWSRAR